MPGDSQAFSLSRLGRKEWALVALGVSVWVALGIGGVWLVHQFTRPTRVGVGAVPVWVAPVGVAPVGVAPRRPPTRATGG